MDSNFTVSVVIPVYNAADYIKRAVHSALSQPETGEVVLVEDGSTDNSLQICKEIALEFPKVKLFRHPNGENMGAGTSRNLAITKSSYDFIAFLDADDFFLPHRFRKTHLIFKEFPDTEGVYECIGTTFLNAQAEDDYQSKNRPLLTTVTRKNIPPNQLFKELVLQKYGYFSLDGFTVRKSILSNHFHFDRKLRIGEDTDFILRLAEKRILRPGILDIPVSIRGVHGANSTLVSKDVLEAKYQFARIWFNRSKNNAWPKSINRHLLLKYSIAEARVKVSGIRHWPLAIINVFKNILLTPWIIRKIL